MSNVANWTSEQTSTTGTGPVTLTGPTSSDLAGFQEAFGSGTVDVYYAIESGNNREVGVGSYNGTTEVLTRTTPTATLVGGVYDDTSPAAISLTGTSTVSCSFNASAFRDFVSGPTSVSADNNLTVYDGTTGKSVKDSNIGLDTVINTGTNSQFSTVAEEITPVSGDVFLIEKVTTGAKRYLNVDNLPGGTPDLTDAEFPTYAVFDAKVTGAAAIDFSTGNKQEVDASTHANVTVTSPTGHPANFILEILNSGSLSSIAPAAGGSILWDGGAAPTWGGTSVLSLYYSGSAWYGTAIVSAA